MIVAGALEIQMMANLARLAEDMRQAKSMVGDSMKGIESAVSSAKSALQTLGIGIGIHGLIELVKSTIDAADHLNDLRKSTNLTIDELSGLQVLARQSGTDMDGLAKATNRMSVEMGKTPERFKALGVTAKDQLGALKQVADIFNKLPDINQRNALAQAMFSKSWAELAPALSEGSAGIQAAVDKGKLLSGQTQQMAEDADKFNDQMVELNTTMNSTRVTAIGGMLPAFNEIAGAMKLAAQEGGALTAIWVGLGGAMAFILGLTDAQKMKNQLDIVNESINQITKDLNKALNSEEYKNPRGVEAIEQMTKALKDFEAQRSKLTAANAPKFTDETAFSTNNLRAVAGSMGLPMAKDAATLEAEKQAKAFLEWEKTESAKKAELKLYQNTLQGLEVELGKLNEQTKVEILNYELTKGSLKTILPEHRAEILAYAAKLDAKHQDIAATKAAVAYADVYIASLERQAQAITDFNRGFEDHIKEIKDETDLLQLEQGYTNTGVMNRQNEIQSLAKLNVQRALIAENKRIDLDLEKAMLALGPESSDENNKRIDELYAIAAAQKAAIGDIVTARENVRMQNDLQREQVADWNRMWSSVENLGKTAFTQLLASGKNSFQAIGAALKASVIDLLYELTARKWIINIGTSVANALGIGSGAGVVGGLGAAGGAGGAAAGGLGVGGWLSAGAGAYGAFTGGMSGIYQYAAGSAAGQALGLSTGQAMAPVYERSATLASEYGSGSGELVSAGSGGLTQTGSYVGSGLATIGAAMAGQAIGGYIGGDKQVAGMSAQETSAIGAAAGAAIGTFIFPVIGTALGAFLGGIAGGTVNAAFGHGPKNYGTSSVAGTLDSYDFRGNIQTPYSQSGGWFSSDRNGIDYQGLPNDLVNQMDTIKTGVRDMFDKFLTGIGETARGFGTWSYSINRVLNSQADWEKLANDIAETMGAAVVPELVALKKDGESLADTLTRVQDEFTMTSRLADLLGKDAMTAFGSIGMASVAMRDNLVNLTGGMQNLGQLTQSYYQNFFSDEERRAIDQRTLTKSFANLGVGLPGSKDAFRALVEAQDLGTQSGQALFAQLLQLAPAFAQLQDEIAKDGGLTDTLNGAATALQAVTDAENARIDSIYKAADVLREAYHHEADSLQQMADKWHGAADSLRSYSASLAGGTSGVTYNAAARQFASTAALARSGDFDAINQLQSVSEQFRTASLSHAGSRLGYARDLARIQGAVSASIAVADTQESAALQQLDILTRQVDSLIEIDAHVVTVAEAIAALNEQVAQLKQIQIDTGKQSARAADVLEQVAHGQLSFQTEAA